MDQYTNLPSALTRLFSFQRARCWIHCDSYFHTTVSFHCCFIADLYSLLILPAVYYLFAHPYNPPPCKNRSAAVYSTTSCAVWSKGQYYGFSQVLARETTNLDWARWSWIEKGTLWNGSPLAGKHNMCFPSGWTVGLTDGGVRCHSNQRLSARITTPQFHFAFPSTIGRRGRWWSQFRSWTFAYVLRSSSLFYLRN